MPAGKSIYTALLKAQSEMGPLLKNATNPHFKNKYADLGAVLDTIREPLQSNGILFYQSLSYFETGQPLLVTVLHHPESDTRIESTFPIACKDQENPQAVMAAITYYRRASLVTLCGINQEDDDGQASSHTTTPTRAGATDVANSVQTAQAKAATPPPQMTHAQFGEAVQQAIDGRRGDELLKLVDEAGTLVARWVTLVKASPTSDALEWIVRQIERRQIADPVLLEAITKQQADLGIAPSTGNGRRDNALPGMADEVAAGKASAERALR